MLQSYVICGHGASALLALPEVGREVLEAIRDCLEMDRECPIHVSAGGLDTPMVMGSMNAPLMLVGYATQPLTHSFSVFVMGAKVPGAVLVDTVLRRILGMYRGRVIDLDAFTD